MRIRAEDSLPPGGGAAVSEWCGWFWVPVPVVCGSLPDIYVEKLLGFVAASLEKSGHLQFYMTWAQSLLMLHGQKLKNRSAPSPPHLDDRYRRCVCVLLSQCD